MSNAPMISAARERSDETAFCPSRSAVSGSVRSAIARVSFISFSSSDARKSGSVPVGSWFESLSGPFELILRRTSAHFRVLAEARFVQLACQLWSALRADIYKEPLRGTLDRPPPSAPSAQTPLLTKEGNGVCNRFLTYFNLAQHTRGS